MNRRDGIRFVLNKVREPEDINYPSFIKPIEAVKEHGRMYHTTTLDTMELIFQNKTLRSSSLVHANLNDPMEKARVGVEPFAAGHFIACFSHTTHERINLWQTYGRKNGERGEDNDRKEKISLKFKNFSRQILETIKTDYCLTADGKKAIFDSEENLNLITYSRVPGEDRPLPGVEKEYDIRNWVDYLEVIDVEYVDDNDKVFTDDHSGMTSIDFSKIMNSETAREIKLPGYRTDCLGRQKTNTWEDERETRILCRLNNQDWKEWDHIDLRLTDEFFRDLVIIMSPWASENMQESIQAIIDGSSLSEDVKKSISIEESILKGKINL